MYCVMSLQNLSLKQEYRSDRDNLVSEFFVPCLSNCIQFDMAIQFATSKSINSSLEDHSIVLHSFFEFLLLFYHDLHQVQ